MDTKSKFLIAFLGIVLFLSFSASYYRYMVLHDYIVEVQVDCDPLLESCFVWQCNENEEECTGNTEEDTWYYKFAYRNAKNVPKCAIDDEDCNYFTCPKTNEPECHEVLCSQDTLSEYEIEGSCTIPEDFLDLSKDDLRNDEDPTVSSLTENETAHTITSEEVEASNNMDDVITD